MKCFSRRFVLALLLVPFILIPERSASAQTYLYTLYDGPDGTGNVMATFTAPLVLGEIFSGGPVVTDFVVNLGAITWNIVPSPMPASTFLSPCVIHANQSGPSYFYFSCVDEITYNNVLTLYFANNATSPVNIPINAPGTYNTNSAPFISSIVYGLTGSSSQLIRSVVIGSAGSPTPTYSCVGFDSPFDSVIAVASKAKKAIPSKGKLLTEENAFVTPQTLTALGAAGPVIEVSFVGVDGTETQTSDALAPGASSVGNSFNFDVMTYDWWFNLSTVPYTAPGTYTVRMKSGDATKYTITTTCAGTFVRKS